MFVNGGDSGVLRSNLLGFAGLGGAWLQNGADGWLIENNEFRGNSATDAAYDGLAVTGQSATVRGNLVIANFGNAIEFWSAGGGHNVENNTVSGNAGNEGYAVAVNDGISGTVFDRNLIQNNVGTGIAIDGGGSGNRITANGISGNTGLGVDLDLNGVTVNDGVMTVGATNLLMDHPVITSATLAGTTLTVAGYVGSAPSQATFAGARVEVFESDNDGTGFGEGAIYLGFLTADASGNFSGTLDVTGKGLVVGETITGTATDGSNNTSEFGANVSPQPPAIVKRAFELDGTPVPSGTVLPKGTVFKFLLYVNNPGGAVSDVSLSDALDAAFEYQSGTIRYDNSQPASTAGACTPAEEAAIFTAANAGTPGTDGVDGDPVCRAATTIHVGDQNAANARLDIAAGRVFATVFTCRMR